MINDEYLLAALRIAAGHDPIPAHVSAAARDAYSLRLAEVVTAGPVECAPTRGTRDADGARMVRFATADLSFDLEVTIGDGLIDVAGRVSPHPGDGATVDIRTPHLTVSRDLRETGQFAATGLPPGWFSVVCHRPGHHPVATGWVRIRP
ncbi:MULTISPECIES: hypothetical protein [unclassified Nonomuraea]|uniref:hypothetical protein n=1 Tax=Nonomuraea sp. NPDC003804 TaxID=3154547 RepID=UPI0033B8359B